MVGDNNIRSIGEIRTAKCGENYKLLEVCADGKLIVQFLDGNGYKTSVFPTNFRSGNIFNPYHRSVFGVGYIGEGNFLTKDGKKQTTNYSVWRNLFQRCYCEEFQIEHPAYIGCSVDERWHNFQTFAQWRSENMYEIPGERMQVDKDILCKGNKVYCPEKCCIVPQRINLIFLNKRATNTLATGVSARGGRYFAAYNTKPLGVFDTFEEAVNAHEKAKKCAVVMLANEYKSKLPSYVYSALINY